MSLGMGGAKQASVAKLGRENVKRIRSMSKKWSILSEHMEISYNPDERGSQRIVDLPIRPETIWKMFWSVCVCQMSVSGF